MLLKRLNEMPLDAIWQSISFLLSGSNSFLSACNCRSWLSSSGRPCILLHKTVIFRRLVVLLLLQSSISDMVQDLLERPLGQTKNHLVKPMTIWSNEELFGQTKNHLVKPKTIWSNEEPFGQTKDHLVKRRTTWSNEEPLGQTKDHLVKRRGVVRLMFFLSSMAIVQ